MKKLIYLIILLLILGLVLTGCLLSDVGQVPTTGQSSIAYLTKHTADAPQVTTLFAGQTIDVGTVSVWNDCVNLYVKYETTGGWVMTETHLAVVTSVADFPTNKPGNLMVGHFPYGEENIFQNTWEEIIELSAIPAKAEQELFIAAHAVVADTSITMEEVVVSRPGIDVYGPLGYYAGLGDIIWGSANLAVATWPHPAWLANINIPDATWISTAEYVEDPVNNSWRWFHDEITLPEKGYYIAGSVVLATADNAEEVYFNEESVGSNGDWRVPTEYSIEPQPGLNTLDFIVRNYAQAGGSVASNPTGLIYKTTVTYYPEESAWAAGFDFPGANWATYFDYTVQLPQDGMVLWLDAGKGITPTSGVSMWADQSGNGNHAVQTNTFYQPTYITDELNDNPVVRFTEGEKYLSHPSILTNDYTTFYVLKLTESQEKLLYYYHAGIINSGDLGFFAEAKWLSTSEGGWGSVGKYPSWGSYFRTSEEYPTPEEWRVHTHQPEKLYKNGTEVEYLRSDDVHAGGLITIGSRSDHMLYFVGDIAEILVYNRILSDSEREFVETYLNAKYDIY